MKIADYCGSRVGTSSAHCDHEFGQAHYTEPRTFQCCYCGRIRTEQPCLTTGGTSDTTGHGPFAPKFRAMY